MKEVNLPTPEPGVLIWAMSPCPSRDAEKDGYHGVALAVSARTLDKPRMLEVTIGCHVRTLVEDGKRAWRRDVASTFSDAGMTASLPMALGEPKGFSFVDEKVGKRFFLILGLERGTSME